MRLDILSENLKWMRKEKGLKLENLEHETGISRTTLSALENLENNPVDTSFRNIVTLADFYGVSIDYLLGREHEKNIVKTEIDELGLTDNAIAKLKKNSRHAQLLSVLITADSFDEFLNRLELLLDRSMESIYGTLNQYYESTLAEIRKNVNGEIPQDEVMNILNHCHFDDGFDRYKLKEYLDVLVDELLQKYGNKITADKGVNSPLNVMLRSIAEMSNAESDGKPTVKDILSHMLVGMPEEDREKTDVFLDGVDTALREKNYTLKRVK